MSERTPPRPRRGAAAVEAAIEEFELRARLDETDPGLATSGQHDLGWARERIGAARRAAAADVVSAEEALDWLAEAVGRELPTEPDDEDRGA